MTVQLTYSLEEAAGIICGRTDDGQVVPGGEQWLAKRLRGEALPALRGYKSARRWRMTEKQVDDALQALEPELVSMPDVPRLSGMTRTSRRRLAS